MEHHFPLTLLLTLLTLLTTPLLLIAAFRQTRKRHNPKPSQTLCYLQTDDPKPQSSFKRLFADNSYHPFKPLDPHCTALNRFLSNLSLYRAPNSHPYEDAINGVLGSCEIEGIRFVDGEVDLEMEGGHVWVERREELVELKEVLSKERVFGVDTEQHSLRSFLGFTALVQISTRSKDYLVDTIALHDVMDILQPVFADPKICKVFHGADNDVMWLQRDFHIYVVNLFDTAKACEVLSKPQKSLAYLLENYCGVITNKKLQLEDWRLRPLSEEMIQYARADAHYLLYIADRMATELKIKSAENPEHLDDTSHFFRETVRLSNMVCLQRYTKEIEASPGNSAASSILSRYFNGGSDSVNSETKELVERLCMWRDLMARVHDESLRYVLSDQAIVSLASKSPTTAEEIYDIISEADMSLDSPTIDSILFSPSPVVRSHLEGIYDLLVEKSGSLGDTLETVIQKHIGTNGTCPLSIYNYALLTKSKSKVTSGFLSKTNGVKGPKRFGRKASRQLFVQKFSCKSPVYHNCRIYASDGRLLCYCDRRKLDWYLRRDLAKLVDNDPPAIMLLFEPKGRPEDEDNDFYIQSKKNMCVGCGERNHYLRYRIIPSCYRVHFPEHLKSHRSHDIVLLCVDCHEVAHSYAEKHKKRIATEFGIPLFVQRVVDSQQTENITRTAGSGENVDEAGVSPLHLRSAAMALLRHGSEMPIKRREELTQIVMKFYGGRKITEEDLERALLVGMSPHERRRVEKKKGLSFRHSSGDHLSSKANNNVDCMDTSTIAEEFECIPTNGSQKTESSQKDNICMKNSTSATDINECCDSDSISKISATDFKDTECKTDTILVKENVLGADEDLACRMLSDDTGDFSQGGPNGTTSRTYNKRLSLLGHGPHGKQVVDHLLKEYGEDGIRVFCQKWRQVFVESVNPRFLPSGWDVMHRGNRDFGDYSVYNPLKKATTDATG